MRTIDFEKIDNRWYVVFDDYEGSSEDLEMVDGADVFLDCITTDGLYASIELFDNEPTTGSCSVLRLIDHDDYGATYQVENCEYFDRTVWLCNVTHLFFGGEHPEMVYFRVVGSQD